MTARIESGTDIRTLVQMTLGTDRGQWWADPDFGSDLWRLRQSGKLGPDVAAKVEAEIKRALAWLVSDRAVQSIAVSTRIADKTRIDYAVLVTRDQETLQIEGVWDAV